MILWTPKIKAYAELIRFNKPVGTLLLLWPMLIALWVSSGGTPEPKVLVVFVLGCFLMRSAGCAVNDFADRHVDGLVERTKNRVLPSKRLSSREALLACFVLALLAFSLCFLTNTLVVKLSVVGALLASIYPFLKRFSSLPQFFLGAAFAWAIPMSYAATLEYIPPHAWILYAATLLWAVAYDTLYALVDKKDDLKVGIRSTAILFGAYTKLVVLVCYLMVSALLAFYAYTSHCNVLPILISLSLGLCAIFYHYAFIQDQSPSQCFKAFQYNQYLGGLWFLGFFVATLY